MEQLTKEMNKVYLAREKLAYAEGVYITCVAVARQYEQENPPLPENAPPLDEIMRRCQENCRKAKRILKNVDRMYNEVRLDFIKYLISSNQTQEQIIS